MQKEGWGGPYLRRARRVFSFLVKRNARYGRLIIMVELLLYVRSIVVIFLLLNMKWEHRTGHVVSHTNIIAVFQIWQCVHQEPELPTSSCGQSSILPWQKRQNAINRCGYDICKKHQKKVRASSRIRKIETGMLSLESLVEKEASRPWPSSSPKSESKNKRHRGHFRLTPSSAFRVPRTPALPGPVLGTVGQQSFPCVLVEHKSRCKMTLQRRESLSLFCTQVGELEKAIQQFGLRYLAHRKHCGGGDNQDFPLAPLQVNFCMAYLVPTVDVLSNSVLRSECCAASFSWAGNSLFLTAFLIENQVQSSAKSNFDCGL